MFKRIVICWMISILVSVIIANRAHALIDYNLDVIINGETFEVESAIKSFMILQDAEVKIKKNVNIPFTYKGHKNIKVLDEVEKDYLIVKMPAKPGVYYLQLITKLQEIKLNFIVLVPYEKISKQKINGYRIGDYPRDKKIKNSLYYHPKGFIEITRANCNTLISPHFKMKQFICKQNGGYPKYITLEESLLNKLENLVETIKKKGYSCSTLAVLSGYRTPYYNQLLGNVRYSAHQYGKAADVYLDENHDGAMDDLNKDGISDYRDAAVLYRLVNQLEYEKDTNISFGGLGLYGRTSTHSSFIHIDVRGYKARWGIEPEIKHARKRYGSKRRLLNN